MEYSYYKYKLMFQMTLVKKLINQSYNLVVNGLTKKAQKELEEL